MKYQAILQVSPEFLVDLVIAVTAGSEPRMFIVSKHGLPPGTSMRSAFMDQMTNQVLILVENDQPFPLSEPPRLHASGFPFLESPECSVYFPPRVSA